MTPLSAPSSAGANFWSYRHDMKPELRVAMIDLLNLQLADTIDLALQAKQAHWNVKGPQFASLHALFDEAAETLHELADEQAERAVSLGGIARGTGQVVAATTRLPVYDLTLLTGRNHVAALTLAFHALAASTRVAIDTATNAGDADTADVFTQVSRALDKLRWQIEAHNVAPN